MRRVFVAMGLLAITGCADVRDMFSTKTDVAAEAGDQQLSVERVGELMAKYGGGGHEGAGSTPLVASAADRLIEQLIADLQDNAPKGSN